MAAWFQNVFHKLTHWLRSRGKVLEHVLSLSTPLKHHRMNFVYCLHYQNRNKFEPNIYCDYNLFSDTASAMWTFKGRFFCVSIKMYQPAVNIQNVYLRVSQIKMSPYADWLFLKLKFFFFCNTEVKKDAIEVPHTAIWQGFCKTYVNICTLYN